jgi:hypothetical protein
MKRAGLWLSIAAMVACGSSSNKQVVPADAAVSPDLTSSIDAQSPAVSCASYCDSALNNCLSAPWQWPTSNQCAAECAIWQQGAYGDRTDSVGCRQQLANQATTDPSQCNAAGPTGAGVCGSRCDSFCRLTFAVCVNDATHRHAMNPFTNMNDCLTACQGFKLDPNAPELQSTATPSNTLNCRQYVLQQAWSDIPGGSAVAHCPALGTTSTECY